MKRLILIVVMLGVGSPAMAAFFLVNTTDDHLDFHCDLEDCSLRDAVYSANINSGMDFILVPEGTFALTMSGPQEDAALSGDLDITDQLFLVGQGPDLSVVDASELGDRVLHVICPGKNVTIHGLTITGGDPLGKGGGIAHRDGRLVLSDVAVVGNHSSHGGGIWAWGDLSIEEGSLVAGNNGTYGGGIFIADAELQIHESTITDNHGNLMGGGIWTSSAYGALRASTVSSNWSYAFGGTGGGIFFDDGSEFELSNCTVYGNRSESPGAAITAEGGSVVSMHSVTVAENDSLQGIDIVTEDAQLTLINSIISGYCDINGSVISEGGNLESPLDTCRLNHHFDQIAVPDAKLMPLDLYGGPTETAMPLVSSPAVNNGTDSYCLVDDQRGYSRYDKRCDVGAVERQLRRRP